MKSVLLFNNKGGVGKTTLTFNIAHLLAQLGSKVVVMDFDPQSNITSIFLGESELEELWDSDQLNGRTVAGCVDLIKRGKGDLRIPELWAVRENLWLLPGSLFLGPFEQTLAKEWGSVQSDDNERAVDVTCSLGRLTRIAGESVDADYVLMDVGPSLGALNRAVLLGCDAVVIPVAPDLFSLQGLRNIGPTLRQWRGDWSLAREYLLRRSANVSIPAGQFQPLGYVLQQHLARSDRPVKGYRDWASRIPGEFRTSVLDEPEAAFYPDFANDQYCIATLKHFASLVPIAQTARKPMFELKQADGIGGGQLQAVRRCRDEFTQLVQEIRARVDALDTSIAGAGAS